MVVVHGGEHLELLCRVELEVEAHCRGEEYGEQYADGLHEVVVDKGKAEGNGCRYKENLYYGVAVFVDV